MRVAVLRCVFPVAATAALLGLIGWALVAGPGQAGAPPETPLLHDRPSSALEADEVAAFVDEILPALMAEHAIPGAVFVMVSDGAIVVERGYGEADIARGTPADPHRSLFDVGSVTKLFTATAMMQLVERGLIDLHTDVNEYLTEFQIPATFSEPVTAAHLLTHTAGFDERFMIGMIARDPDAVAPLSETLQRHQPPRIRPPDQVVQYSNYGTTLAGHLVETVSGQPFVEYVEEHILQPLGMQRSTFGYPPDLAPDMAELYRDWRGEPEVMEPWYLNVLPAGGLWSTGVDIAAFMLAHLASGEHEGGRILLAETAEEMHRTQFTPHPSVHGMAYGFFEHRVGERRGLHHGGDWVSHSSLLYLLPDEEAGFFVGFNHPGGMLARVELTDALLDRFFHVEPFSGAPAADAASRLAMFEGTYRWTRQDRHTFTRFPATLLNATMQVTAEDDGTLRTTLNAVQQLVPEGHETGRWVETEPLVFKELGGHRTLVFELDGNGDAVRLHSYWPLPLSMERIAWYQQASLHLGLAALFLAAFISSAAWPLMDLYRRIRRRTAQTPPALWWARVLGGATSGLLVAFFLGIALHVAVDTVGVLTVSTGVKALLWLPIIGALLTIPFAVAVGRTWWHGEGSLVARIHPTIVAVALVAFIPFMYYWRLLGFHY